MLHEKRLAPRRWISRESMFLYGGWFGIPLVFVAAICFFVPLGSAYIYGADEGYELIKAFLWFTGHDMYTEIWNNMPPAHTWLLKEIFSLFGVTLWGTRFLSVLLAACCLASMFAVVRRQTGLPGAWIASLLLLASPTFLELSVSVMLELPAFAVAWVSYAVYLRACPASNRAREPAHDTDSAPGVLQAGLWVVILSGALMGVALQIKYTAALMIPALAAHGVAELAGAPLSRPSIIRFVRTFVVWTAAVAVVFVFILLLAPGQRLDTHWSDHFTMEVRNAFMDSNRWEISDWFDPGVLSWIASMGVVYALLTRRARFLPAIVFLGILCLAHTINRPYWSYYDLHFVLGMAWLAGLALDDSFALLQAKVNQAGKMTWKCLASALVWCACFSLMMSDSSINLIHGFEKITRPVLVQERLMGWNPNDFGIAPAVPADEMPVIDAFHFRIQPPAHTAVNPRKRRILEDKRHGAKGARLKSVTRTRE